MKCYNNLLAMEPSSASELLEVLLKYDEKLDGRFYEAIQTFEAGGGGVILLFTRFCELEMFARAMRFLTIYEACLEPLQGETQDVLKSS